MAPARKSKDKPPDTKTAEELDGVIDEVLRSSRSLVDQLENLLQRARELVKENKRLLAERDKHRRHG
jgi:hypothetical protein